MTAQALIHPPYTLRIRTDLTRWSASLRRIAVARPRVGKMFRARFGPLMVSQRFRPGVRPLGGELRVSGEVRTRVPEGRLAQRQESRDVPVAYVVGIGVDVDREIEEVADGQPGGAVGPARAGCSTLSPSTIRMSGRRTHRRPARCRSPGGRRPARSPCPGRTSRPSRTAAAPAGRRTPGTPCDASARAVEFGVGYRKPSVVTRATRGCSGQAASSSCSSRAVVDLPTATEPATPITNGVRARFSRRNSLVERCSSPVCRK